MRNSTIIIIGIILVAYSGLIGFRTGTHYVLNNVPKTDILSDLRRTSFELGYRKALLTVYKSLNTDGFKSTLLPSDSLTTKIDRVRVDTLFWKPDSLWFEELLNR